MASRLRLRKRLSDGLILPAAARCSRRPLLGIAQAKKRQGTAWLFWLMTVGGYINHLFYYKLNDHRLGFPSILVPHTSARAAAWGALQPCNTDPPSTLAGKRSLSFLIRNYSVEGVTHGRLTPKGKNPVAVVVGLADTRTRSFV